MSDEKRPYRKKVRAELEDETRRRITVSAMELHGTVGPARTSISAVAERAGVRRSTVYRHFPDEEALFAACSAHWAASNPPPDPSAWAGIEDPDERTRVALLGLYEYYRGTEQMLSNLLRDEDSVPAIAKPFQAYRGLLAWMQDQLAAGRGLRGNARRRTAAAIGHALALPTWRSLVLDQGLSDAEAAEMMAAFVASAP